MAASEHTTRHQGGDTVDEYRQNGKVWMIHIVPQGGGPDETFMDTSRHRTPHPRSAARSGLAGLFFAIRLELAAARAVER